MFIHNQIISCKEIIGSQPSVLRTKMVKVSKIDFQFVWLSRADIMRTNIFLTHNYYVYSIVLKKFMLVWGTYIIIAIFIYLHSQAPALYIIMIL